jgi:hypothetical protein
MMRMRQHRSARLLLLWPALAGAPLLGCHEPAARRELSHPDSMVKILTIKEISRQERDDAQTLAQLVEELDNRDPAVRLYAINALRNLTGQSFDYRYFDDELDRKPALEKWRRWLADQSSGGASQSVAGQPGRGG